MSRPRTPALLAAIAIGVAALAGAAVPATAAAGAAEPLGKKITPLFDSTPLKRKVPAKQHAYVYETTTFYWSVLAADPDSFLDTNLVLYGAKNEQDWLGSSHLGEGTTDFIAVDSNHHPLQTYYPQIYNASQGSGKYVIELAEGHAVVNDGFQQVDMSGSALVGVRDTLLTAGVNYRFVLSPTDSHMRGSLFLMGSDFSDPDPFIQPRSDSVAKGIGVSGQATVVDFTPAVTDWYGVVVLSEGTGGVFGLHRLTS